MIRRVLLTEPERKSLKLGVRGVIWREVKASNSVCTPAKFADLDLRNAYVKPFSPAMELRARGLVKDRRRSVVITSAIRQGDLIVNAHPRRDARKRFQTCYVVRKVACHRVRSVTHADALIEGFVASHYAAALKRLGKLDRARWERSEQHRVATLAPDAADVFALDWIATHGFQSWRLNPWVWAYMLEVWEADPETVIKQLDRVAQR